MNPLVLKDVGSGLNEKRANFQKLLTMVCNNEVRNVYVTYKDRLTRFGFYYLETIFLAHDVKIIVVKDSTLNKLTQEELVEDMLQKFDGLEKVTLEIQKPWAPVGLPLKTVSVRITRSWHTAYIALGSNMGDSRQILDGAVSAIDALPASKVEKVSGFITTPPYGVTDQPDFLNGCLRMKTLYYPKELLRELNRIEKEAGRERIIHWGPRTLDLDIIFYDDLISQEDDLCIPHVEMHKRSFVLEPLEEIAPYKRHPGNGKTVRQMLEELTIS